MSQDNRDTQDGKSLDGTTQNFPEVSSSAATVTQGNACENSIRTEGNPVVPGLSPDSGDGQRDTVHRGQEPNETPATPSGVESGKVDGNLGRSVQRWRRKVQSVRGKKSASGGKSQSERNGFDLKLKRSLKRGYRARHGDSQDVIRVNYKPFGHQRKFAELIESGKKLTLFVGGRQGGKTFAGAREALKQIYKYGRKPSLGWIISPTYPMSLVVERAFEDAAGWFETGGLILKKFAGQRAYLLHPPKGSQEPFRVEIKTAENPDRLRGAGLGFIWMDEAAMMSEEVYKILLGCILATKGIIFMTSTPKGRNWFYRLFCDAETNPVIGVVKSRSEENTELGKQELAMMRAHLSEDFARQELEAEFVSFDGLVYRGFNWTKHVIPPVTQIPAGAELIAGIDNGYGDPFCHLWIMKKDHKYYVIDEYYEKGRPLDHVARSIKSNVWDKHIIRRWHDPSGAQERADLLDRHGIGTYPAHNDIVAGINEVEKLFEQNRIYVAQNCVNTLNELTQYHYVQREGKNSGEEPEDAFNHAMDALRYAIFSESRYGVAHPVVHIADNGQLSVDDGSDPWTSDKLENWINFPVNPVGEIPDSGY